MTKERKVYVFLGVMFVLYVIVSYYTPKPMNWSASFHPADKNPYGCFILFDRISDLTSHPVRTSDQTLYEMQDSVGNVLILATQARLADTDIASLLARLSRGDNVLIAADQFSQALRDTLAFETGRDELFRLPNATDTVSVTFGSHEGRLSDVLVQTYFELPDGNDWRVLASGDEPLLIERIFGSGRLLLSSTPLAFSNFALLQDHQLAEYALMELGEAPLQYSHYYQTGKIRSSSPFRYVLTQESLKWALYLSLAVIGCLVFFDSQRRQRMVAVVPKPQNGTVQFVKTIGALFYRERNNKRIAQKLTSYFLEDLYKKYHKAPIHSEKYYEWLSHKTGVTKSDVLKAFQYMKNIDNKEKITDEELVALNNQITAFRS